MGDAGTGVGDAEEHEISCQAFGYQEAPQLTWTSTASWAYNVGEQWQFVIHDELIGPVAKIFLEECSGSDCQLVETSVDTSMIDSSNAALTATADSDPGSEPSSGLSVECTLNVQEHEISCQAFGYQEDSQLTWTSTASWVTIRGNQWQFVIEDELIAPVAQVFLEECQGSSCETAETSIDTSALVPEGEVAELTVDCSFDEPNRQLSCSASVVGKWTTSLQRLADSFDMGNTYGYMLEWGEIVEEISVQFQPTECDESDCDSVSTTLDVALQPRGDCPDDFKGWFTTFPLEDLELVEEVGPPARFFPQGVRKGHGYFRVPWGQNTLDVRLPVDATLYHGLNYMEQGLAGGGFELQHRLEFHTNCEGLRIRLDHIAEPIPEITALFTREPRIQDSVATMQAGGDYDLPLFEMKAGDLVGTVIGLPLDVLTETGERGNAWVDLGVYDDFHRIPTAQDPQFRNAVCYYDFFSSEIATYLRSKTLINTPIEEDVCP